MYEKIYRVHRCNPDPVCLGVLKSSNVGRRHAGRATPSAPPTAQASTPAPPSSAPSPTPDADAAYSRRDIEFDGGDYASLGRLMEKCGFGLMDTMKRAIHFIVSRPA